MRFTRVAEGVGFTEGPVCTASGAVAFCSVDRGVVHRLGDGGCEVLAVTAGGPNGLAEGADGTLFVAQNGGRWATAPHPTMCGGVQSIAPEGAVAWLTQDPIAPNDVCVGPDGWLYVTDPTRRPEMDDGRLWCVDPVTGEADLLVSVGWYPNGIGFGPDDALYVARSGEGVVLRYDGARGRPLAEPEAFCEVPGAHPDGFAWDVDGNLLVAAVGIDAPGTLRVFDSDGDLVETLAPGPSRHYTNLAISTDGDLYVTDADGGCVLRARWPAPGLPLHPSRGRRAVDRTAMRDYGSA